MNEETPQANPPLTAQERKAVAQLSNADLTAIDSAILEQCCEHWYKVARVVSKVEDTLKNRYPNLSYNYYAQRLCQLADKGVLESQGNLIYMRFSEVRLPP